MGEIQKITFYCHLLMVLFDAKFVRFLILALISTLCHKTTKHLKISNPFCNFQDITHIYSLAKN